jgi:hypothetical protein
MAAKISARQAKAAGIVPEAAKPRKRGKGPSAGDNARQAILMRLALAHGLPEPWFEYQFHTERRWRFDLCWLRGRIALEIQGGIFSGGRHVQGAALLDEMEKLNEAAILGWRVLFCTPQQLESGAAFQLVHRALGGKT